MIDLFEVTRPVAAGEIEVGIGLKTEGLAAMLRRLADRIEAGELSVTKVQHYQVASEDWFRSALVLELEEFRLIDRSTAAPAQRPERIIPDDLLR